MSAGAWAFLKSRLVALRWWQSRVSRLWLQERASLWSLVAARRKRSKIDSIIVADILCLEARVLRKTQFARMNGFEAEWWRFSVVVNSSEEAIVFVVDLWCLHDVELLFELYVRWTQDIGAVKPKLEQVCGWPWSELPMLQMTVFAW